MSKRFDLTAKWHEKQKQDSQNTREILREYQREGKCLEFTQEELEKENLIKELSKVEAND